MNARTAVTIRPPLILAALALLVAGCSHAGSQETTTPPSPPAHLLTGVVSFSYGAAAGSMPPCSDGGRGGYADLQPGGVVTVTDGAGKVIGVGSLANPGENSAGDCQLGFAVHGLPDRAFYGVEVTHRGVVRYSRDQLRAAEWAVSLSIG
jgi:hypothetical protein